MQVNVRNRSEAALRLTAAALAYAPGQQSVGAETLRQSAAAETLQWSAVTETLQQSAVAEALMSWAAGSARR
jgi:hypothetical protein